MQYQSLTLSALRSAEFDESQNVCRLSREDRRSQPSAFRRQPGSPVDYLENQCVRCKCTGEPVTAEQDDYNYKILEF